MLRKAIFIILVFTAVFFPAGWAQAGRAQPCDAQDRGCMMDMLEQSAAQIENVAWRDQTYRELAKTLAFENETDRAIAMIDKIETPDTKAMTIRGIGMAVADKKWPAQAYQPIFQKLRLAANKITHPPSFAIALTYIAMSQAFAGDNEGAWKTAAEMENEALRHKAYGETAEIQAENGDFAAAIKSIEFITSPAYKNKAYETISKILADEKKYDEALRAAGATTNPYKQAEALQYILDKQKPREIERLKSEEGGKEN